MSAQSIPIRKKYALSKKEGQNFYFIFSFHRKFASILRNMYNMSFIDAVDRWYVVNNLLWRKYLTIHHYMSENLMELIYCLDDTE